MLTGAVLSIVLGQPAKATDEIQVYNAGIAAVGQFTIQQHLNYVPLGLKDPPFPGGLVSNHSLNGTSVLADPSIRCHAPPRDFCNPDEAARLALATPASPLEEAPPTSMKESA